MASTATTEPAAVYRLSLAPALEPFRPEITHALDFVDAGHGLRREDQAARVLHVGEAPPEGALHLEEAVFSHGLRIAADGLWPRPEELAALAAGDGPLPLLPTDDGRPFDALGLIALMLTRVEERGSAETDRYDRFPYAASLAARFGFHHRPVADVAAAWLAERIAGRPCPPVRAYAARPTHDVDRLRGYHRPLTPLRTAAGDLLKRRRPGRAWARLQDGYLGGEPWRSLRWLMDLSEAHGLRSRFYFLGPSRLSMDSPYVETMPGLLRRVAGEIRARGHDLGFHPGYATFDDAAEWTRQRDGLEAVLGEDIREGRQHVLRWRAEDTPDIWDAAGMTFDCTPAWPEANGFRTGSSRPHAAYSLRQRRPLRLQLASTQIMEFGLFGGKYRDLSVEEALDECRPLIDATRHYGGELVLLYHTGQTQPPLTDFYQRLLALATEEA